MKLVRWVQRIARIDIRFAVTRAGGDPRYIKRSLGVTWMQWIARDCTEVHLQHPRDQLVVGPRRLGKLHARSTLPGS